VSYLQKTTPDPLVPHIYIRLHLHWCNISTKDYTCSTSVTYQQKITPALLVLYIYKLLHMLH